MKIKKSLIWMLVASTLSMNTATYANNVTLPDIGTSAVTTLSIGQEMDMGDYYVRMLRGSTSIMNDPVLSNYINQLGGKLVAHADSVQMPFNFYVMRSNILNAFAFFGGHVVIHSRLILDTDNESQLASVMAHEISHVTQRHLARSMEAQKNANPYVWGAALGSLLLTLASPEAGMAALTTTVAGSAQKSISFTQSNEQEADRVGIRILTNSGFDPYGSPEFLQKLSDQMRFMSKPPEMLLTHPLPDSRLTDVRNRAIQYERKNYPSSLDYFLAKTRLIIQSNNKDVTSSWLTDLNKITGINAANAKIAATYGEAFSLLKQDEPNKAKGILQPLLNKQPENVWFIDLMTDIDLANQQATVAITRLQDAIKKDPDNSVLQLNLANAYVINKDYQRASSLLHRYTRANPNDVNGWEILGEAYAGQKLRAEEMSVRAELLALHGQYQQAIHLLNNAKSYTKNEQTLARLDARAIQLTQLQQKFTAFER